MPCRVRQVLDKTQNQRWYDNSDYGLQDRLCTSLLWLVFTISLTTSLLLVQVSDGLDELNPYLTHCSLYGFCELFHVSYSNRSILEF